MSTDPIVLGVLGAACKEELQMFERVNVVHSSEQGLTCFICIGKHGIFFVSKEMDELVEGQRLPYLQVEAALTDLSTRRLFLLRLTADRDAAWDASDRILIESHHRQTLLERIALCWQAEYMCVNYQVEKLPQQKGSIGAMLPGSKGNIDLLQVKPFKEYEDDFNHRGYSFFLRSGFKSSSGLKHGTFVHDTGWDVKYNAMPVRMPPGIQVTVHVRDPISIMELEKSSTGADDIRTVATEYKQAITEQLTQFYVIFNNTYMKRMNRTGDMAAWDGWEFFIRSKEFVFACILFRREYIPPVCDIAQDVAVLLRCPAQDATGRSCMTQDMCEVLLDECRFIADSLASTAESKVAYRELLQARLDSLQFHEEAYKWFEGHLKLTPVHKKPAAIKFVKSIVKILDSDGQIYDDGLLDEAVFKDIPVLVNPLLVPQEMLSDADGLLGSDDPSAPPMSGMTRDERRNAWYCRISRYLAYCLDGGLIGDRFNMSKLVWAVGKGSTETDRILKAVVEFLLHVTPRDDWRRPFSGARTPLSQLLQEPQEFGKCTFNERMMRTLLQENYIQSEWRKKSSTSGGSYEKLLAALLTSDNVGVGLRTLICRQILEPSGGQTDARQAVVLVPALIKVMHGYNISLASCATAALVNLSSGNPTTKTLLVGEGVLKLCIRQLKAKDDDLTLYTLYLLVNLTKTPHHRAIVVKEGGVPGLVDILSSSYQNLRKYKLLTEVSSVIGQLCNDNDTRALISEEFPVVPCLLWVFDSAQPKTKLKAKLLFALRQLCMIFSNKVKVGQHVIPVILDELSLPPGKDKDGEECATNAVLLLTSLCAIHSNAEIMSERLGESLEGCGLEVDGVEAKKHGFGPRFYEKVVVLKEKVREAVFAKS